MKSEYMNIRILTFGIIAELIQQKEFTFQGIHNTEELKTTLEQKYPALKNIKYSIAVNKQMTAQHNIIFNENDTIALLPPFSGG